MKLTPLQKRAERKDRNKTALDMNLVSLIDIFTILIFFLMSSAAGVEILSPSKAVRLPQSSADKAPRETLVITVSGPDILVEGRRVASVSDALAADGDVIAALKDELDAARQAPGDPRREPGPGQGDHDHGRQGHPVPPAAQGDGHRGARRLRERVVRGHAAGDAAVKALKHERRIAVSFRTGVLPWAIAPEDEARFRRIRSRIVGACLIACIAFALLPRPKEDRAAPQELPPRLAKLVLEREPVAKPPPKPAEPQRVAKADIPQEPLPPKADPRPAPARERTKEAPVPEARTRSRTSRPARSKARGARPPASACWR